MGFDFGSADMNYPDYMTEEDIMLFEYEYNRWLDIDHSVGQFWAVNAELQALACDVRESVLAYQEDQYLADMYAANPRSWGPDRDFSF